MQTHTTALSEAFKSHLLLNVSTLQAYGSVTCV